MTPAFKGMCNLPVYAKLTPRPSPHGATAAVNGNLGLCKDQCRSVLINGKINQWKSAVSTKKTNMGKRHSNLHLLLHGARGPFRLFGCLSALSPRVSATFLETTHPIFLLRSWKPPVINGA
jgi:hypothetical protein